MSVPSNLDALQSVLDGLMATARPDGQGQIVGVSSSRSHVGTSFVARTLAMLAATKMNADQRVLLVDADLQNNAQSAAFFSDAFMSAYGMPQGPFDACFGQIPFWMVTPNSAEHGSDARFVSLHTSMGGRLALTHFHWELVKPGQNVMIRAVRDYWHNLRANFSYAFVDIPAFDRANLKEEICAEADTTLLVSDQSDHHSTGIKSLYDELNASGAHCAGLVINALPVYAAFSGDAP